jgi:hypothetical protein
MLPKYKEVVIMDEQVKLPGSKFNSMTTKEIPQRLTNIKGVFEIVIIVVI